MLVPQRLAQIQKSQPRERFVSTRFGWRWRMALTP